MTINGIKITDETIRITRLYFIDNLKACIADAESGETRVNNLTEYVAWCNKRINSLYIGESDNNLTFAQHALYVQTGECIGILS